MTSIRRSQACIQNPLLESEIASGQIFRNRFLFWSPRVFSKVGDAGDDCAAQMLNDLLCLIREDLPGKARYRVFLGEASAGSQSVEVLD